MKKERNSNFELLRIFAMLMIVMHHYICHGGFVFDKALTFNKAVSECAYWGGKVGINLFVLITGYFMVKGTWKLSKVLVLYGEILFYSWLISIFFVLIGWEPISIQGIIKMVFPFLIPRHNYTTTYIMLYMSIPFINKFISSLSKKSIQFLIAWLSVILIFIPSIMELYIGWTNNVYSYLIWMIYIYICGAYIRLYGKKWEVKMSLTGSILSIVALWILTVFVGQFTNINPYYFASKTYSIPVVVASLFLFKFFENLNIRHNKYINYVASSTFAVYLIHDDGLFRNNVWTKVFKGNTLLSSNYLVINIILTTLMVFIFAIIIDKVRIILQRPIFNYFNSNGYIVGIREKIKCVCTKIADINL